MTKLSALTADTTVGGSENLLIVDTSAGATKRVTTSRVKGAFRTPYHDINWGSNTYYQSPYLDVNSTTTVTLSASFFYISWFLQPYDIEIDSLSVEVTTGAASSTVYLAIYNATSPFGSVTTPVSGLSPTTSLDTSTTGVKTVSFTATTLPAGLYATVVQSSSTGGQVLLVQRGFPSDIWAPHSDTSPFSYESLKYKNSQAWGGSWPSNITANVTSTSSGVGINQLVFFSRP